MSRFSVFIEINCLNLFKLIVVYFLRFRKSSVVFSGTPNNGTPWAPYYSHTTPIFESLKIWEWHGNSLGPAYHKGVRPLEVPGSHHPSYDITGQKGE